MLLLDKDKGRRELKSRMTVLNLSAEKSHGVAEVLSPK